MSHLAAVSSIRSMHAAAKKLVIITPKPAGIYHSLAVIHANTK